MGRLARIPLSLLLFSLCLYAVEPSKHLIVFMTDFGNLDDSVAICKGVMLTVDPEARVVDLLHDVAPYSIADGARFLAGTTPYYPSGTVFLVVIDPGVGSRRKAIVARSKAGHYFVLPDNGLLTKVQDFEEIAEVHEITNPKWMIGEGISSTFHGRDIFSPAAAHLARGDSLKDAGPNVDPASLIRIVLSASKVEESGISGEAFAVDGPYGNLITNISRADFERLGYGVGEKVAFRLKGKEMAAPFVKTFSDVPTGQMLFYIDSRGRLALAINQGNFATQLGVTPPLPVFIPAKPKR